MCPWPHVSGGPSASSQGYTPLCCELAQGCPGWVTVGWSHHQELPCLFLLMVALVQSQPGLLSSPRLTIPITREATESEEECPCQVLSEPKWAMWVTRAPAFA